MSIISRLVARYLKLPQAETYNVAVEADIAVPMPDGVTLLADRYYPRAGEKRPLLLVRTPYGRTGLMGLLYGRLFAERGFQVLVQSCRGTADSGGQLNPFHQERPDGLATVEWLKAQDWFPGQFATIGGSYLGFTQWAIASEAGPELKAMVTQITSAEFRTVTYPGEALWLESAFGWTHTMHMQANSPLKAMLGQLFSRKDPLADAYRHLPLHEVDQVAIGKTVDFWQDWLAHDQLDDDWWEPCDFSEAVAKVTAPDYMIGGWYDIFLPHTLRDYARLRASGQNPNLTIGPWVHIDILKMSASTFAESISWLRAHLLGDRSGLREMPVRIYVMGTNEWRDLPDFPPANMESQRWYLQADSGLAPALPAASEPDHYRYDPADPTPNLGGAGLGKVTGPKDNRQLEARPDVLTYTSAPLTEALEIIGPVQAELYVKSSLEYTDFFARLCDVDPTGKSTNICDMLVRLAPGRSAPEPDGSLKVIIDLWPTAYHFHSGHRLRLQVSSGAFPRWARNPGCGEPLATATTLKVAEQTIYHDPDHPSAIILPIMV